MRPDRLTGLYKMHTALGLSLGCSRKMRGPVEILESARNRVVDAEFTRELIQSLQKHSFNDNNRVLTTICHVYQSCRPDMDSAIIAILRYYRGYNNGLTTKVFEKLKFRRIREKIIEFLDDDSFSQYRNSTGYDFALGAGIILVRIALEQGSRSLAARILKRGLEVNREFPEACIEELLSECTFVKNDMVIDGVRFIVKFARSHGAQVSGTQTMFMESMFNPSADILSTLLKNKILPTSALTPLNVHSELPVIFAVNVGVMSPLEVFRNCKDPDIRIYILQNTSLKTAEYPDDDFPSNTAEVNAFYDYCVENSRDLTHFLEKVLAFPEYLPEYLHRDRGDGCYLEFRVACALTGANTENHLVFDWHLTHILVDSFREGRYCAKDPGFLVMLWCTAEAPGRHRRLPQELTRMVFEFAFTG